jgi:hypothetical protein
MKDKIEQIRELVLEAFPDARVVQITVHANGIVVEPTYEGEVFADGTLEMKFDE